MSFGEIGEFLKQELVNIQKEKERLKKLAESNKAKQEFRKAMAEEDKRFGNFCEDNESELNRKQEKPACPSLIRQFGRFSNYNLNNYYGKDIHKSPPALNRGLVSVNTEAKQTPIQNLRGINSAGLIKDLIGKK